MKRKNLMVWAMVLCTTAGLTACGIEEPKMKNSSFETMTVKKTDIELPYKFSAR